MNSQVDAFWKQKWFPWALGVTVACVVTAVVLIIVLVPGGKKKGNSNQNTEYRYNGYDDYDYNGSTSASQVKTIEKTAVEYDPYDDWGSAAEEEYYGGYDPYGDYGIEYDDDYYGVYDGDYDNEYIVSQFEWVCEYGDAEDLMEFYNQYDNIDPSDFTNEQLERIQVAAMKLEVRMPEIYSR